MLIFYIEINTIKSHHNISRTTQPHNTMDRSNLNTLFMWSYLPIVAFFAKIVIDAFGSNVKATSSIVQYSLIILYLAVLVVILANYLFTPNTAYRPNNTVNFLIFAVAMFWMMCNYILILILNAMNLDILNRGDLTPSVNDPTINNWILIPQMALTFYNLVLFLQCDSKSKCTTVSWVTLTIIALALIQMYLIVNSFRTMQTWPTDDATRNIPTPAPSA